MVGVAAMEEMGVNGPPQQQGVRPPAVLIVNTRSRRGAEYFHLAHRYLKELGVNLVRSYPIERREDLLRAVRGAEEERVPLIIVGGGDGTISAVADLLAQGDTVLGVLPLGTGNDFPRALGIPDDLEGACRALAAGIAVGRVEVVNLARINGRHFVNTALIGYAGHMNHAVPNWLKRVAGRTAYALAAGYSLLASRPFRAAVAVDGERQELETTLVVVGNCRFHPPAQADQSAQRSDCADLLVVQMPRDARPTTLARLAFEFALLGRLDPSLLVTLTGRRVFVEADPPQEIDVDGEPAGWTPAAASVALAALRLVLPPEGAADERRPPLAA